MGHHTPPGTSGREPGGTAMTITQPTQTTQTTSPTPVSHTVDLYRDVHKGIRAELFAVTGEAGRVDPHDAAARVALGRRVRALVEILAAHAGHEDTAIQP